MVNTLVDHRSDVVKCTNLKWNHEPQASGFAAITFFFFFTKNQKQNNRPFVTCYVISAVYTLIDQKKLSINQRARIRSVIVKCYFFLRFAKRSGTLIE